MSFDCLSRSARWHCPVHPRSGHAAAVALFLAACIALGGGVCSAELGLPAGYGVYRLPLDPTPGGDGAFVSTDPSVLFYGGGDYTHNVVVRSTLVDAHTTPTTTIWAEGGLRTGQAVVAGNNVLDAGFGSVGGLVMLSSRTAVVIDNAQATSAVAGETLFLCRDLNADGDCRDIVSVGGTPVAEVLPFSNPIPGMDFPGDFSGAQAERAPDGSILLVTADGAPHNGEVLRVADPTTVTSPIAIYADYGTSPVSTVSLQYGGGMDFLADGSAIVGNSDLSIGTGAIYKLKDLNNDKDALDAGEAQLLTTTTQGVFDLTVGSDGFIYATVNSAFGDPAPKHRVVRVNATTGATTVFADLSSESFYITTVVFDSRTRSFLPSAVPSPARLCVFDGGMVKMIVPLVTAGAKQWQHYE
jgi:hypothetical protein